MPAVAGQGADNPELIIYQTSLQKPLGTKKNAVGEIVRVRTITIEGRPRFLISEFIGHILEVHPRGKNDKESHISLRFDMASVAGLEKPLRTSIRAIASVDSVRPELSPVIVDRYPCREDEKCSKDQQDQVKKLPPALRGGIYPALCGQKILAKSRNTKSVCSDLLRAEGIFGIDGIALQPLTQDPDQGSIITSSKKNISIDAGSYFILAVKNASTNQAASRH